VRGAKAENVCGVGVGAGIVFSFSFPFLSFDVVEVGGSTSFPFSFVLGTSVSTTTSGFVFSFELAGLVDVCEFGNFWKVRTRLVVFTRAADPLDVEEAVVGGGDEAGTERLISPSAGLLFRLDAALDVKVVGTFGGDEVGVGTDRLIASPSATPCWVLFRLDVADEVAETVGGDEDGVDTDRLIASPSCWLPFRLEAGAVAEPLVAETGGGEEVVEGGTEDLTSPSARVFFRFKVVVLLGHGSVDGMVTEPCLVRFVIPFPFFLSSDSVGSI
jgi:hypothetical protein